MVGGPRLRRAKIIGTLETGYAKTRRNELEDRQIATRRLATKSSAMPLVNWEREKNTVKDVDGATAVPSKTKDYYKEQAHTSFPVVDIVLSLWSISVVLWGAYITQYYSSDTHTQTRTHTATFVPAASPYEHVDGWRKGLGGHHFLALRKSSGISAPEEQGACSAGLTSLSWMSSSSA